MGEARKTRLALIKGGKADQARLYRPAPERLVNITVQMPAMKAEILDAVYDQKVDKKTCPTRNDFMLALLESGMIQFEQFYLETNTPQRPAIEVDPATDQPVPEGTL